jgi:hypothetical protein
MPLQLGTGAAAGGAQMLHVSSRPSAIQAAKLPHSCFWTSASVTHRPWKP